jgi:hypothetical protein
MGWLLLALALSLPPPPVPFEVRCNLLEKAVAVSGGHEIFLIYVKCGSKVIRAEPPPQVFFRLDKGQCLVVSGMIVGDKLSDLTFRSPCRSRPKGWGLNV